jgi:hypothetical protein
MSLTHPLNIFTYLLILAPAFELINSIIAIFTKSLAIL